MHMEKINFTQIIADDFRVNFVNLQFINLI